MIEDRVFEDDLNNVAQYEYIKYLYNTTVLVTGATGLIGFQLIKALLRCNDLYNAHIEVIGLARDENKARELFQEDYDNAYLSIYYQDITETVRVGESVDFIIHTASITTSKVFVTKPVETLEVSIMGTKNILEFAKQQGVKSMVYISSMEVYGITDEKKNMIMEENLGYIDILNVRSCYPEGKRICECMCNAYVREYGVKVSIARLAQTFGAGVDLKESRVFAQFAKSVIEKQDIVLHTEGKSYGNYCYTRDAIKAIILLLVKGEKGEAYNITNERNTVTIKHMAEMVAHDIAGDTIKVVYDISSDNRQYGYAPDVVMRLSASKLGRLGWQPEFDLKECYERLIESFKTRYNK